MSMTILSACIYVHQVHAWHLMMPEAGIIFPKTRVTKSCEPPGGCWDPYLGPLQE